VRHRGNGLPAVITDQGKEFYEYGELHRENDLPAIDSHVCQAWFVRGKQYRPNTQLPLIIHIQRI
jgi:hypothetical protein